MSPSERHRYVERHQADGAAQKLRRPAARHYDVEIPGLERARRRVQPVLHVADERRQLDVGAARGDGVHQLLHSGIRRDAEDFYFFHVASSLNAWQVPPARISQARKHAFQIHILYCITLHVSISSQHYKNTA